MQKLHRRSLELDIGQRQPGDVMDLEVVIDDQQFP